MKKICLFVLGVALALATCLFLPPVLALDSDETDQTSEMPTEPLEEYDMPPAPSPLWGIGVSPGMISVHDQFTSHQVNVNGAGLNITGDAANEPSIAVDPTDGNRMVIGWRQFNSVTSNFRQSGYGYTSNGGSTWTFPGVLENNVFRSDPVLVADDTGKFFYNSLLETFFDNIWRSLDSGQTWTNLQGAGNATGGDKQWHAIDNTNSTGHGFQYQAWSTAGNNFGGRQFSRSTDGGVTWMNPINIPNSPIWGTLDVDSTGNLFIGGVNGSFRCLRSSNAKNGAVTPTFDQNVVVNMGGSIQSSQSINPEGLVGQLFLAVDRSGTATNNNIYMLASLRPTGAAGGADVRFARSTNGGTSFSASIRINDDAVNPSKWHWMSTLSVAPNGRIDSVWLDTRNAANNTDSQLFYSYSTDGGVTWAPNVSVSNSFNPFLGYPQQNKMGDYLTMVSDNTGANVAYAATFNLEEDIYHIRVAPAGTTTPTPTPPATPTPSPTPTPATPTPTPPATPTPSATHTPTPTPPATPTPTPTPATPTPTPPATPTPSATHTPTPTPPTTPTPTPTPPTTPSPTATVPPTPSPTPSTPTPTPSGTPATPTPTPSEPPAVDILVGITDSPDPVPAGQNLTYTITVTNAGMFGASNVTMTDTLPAGVNFVSVTSSQGSCSGTSTVGCSLGSLPSFGSASVTLVVAPTVAGPLSNTANAPYPGDPSPLNNSATAVTTVLPATTPTPTPPGTPTPTPPAPQAINLSTRMRVQTGANVGIGGFIITGTGPKHVLLRAIGPSLTGSGVPNALADPVLELHGPGGFTTVTSDNWRDDPAQEALIIASGIAPTNDFESAIDANLSPGIYTAIVSGKNNTTGVGLVEAYDLSPTAPAKLGNISTRAFVGSGSDVVIAGFILGNPPQAGGNDRIVVRGIGPSLAAQGVPDALADPVLELRNGNGVLLVSNNDWHDNPVQASELIAAGLAPGDDLESGIAATLPPGTYTALLAGLNNGTGVGLVEVYDRGAP